MDMDIIGIYLFDQNMGMAFVKARCTHVPLVLIFLGEMQLSVIKSRSALSPLASCWTVGQMCPTNYSHLHLGHVIILLSSLFIVY